MEYKRVTVVVPSAVAGTIVELVSKDAIELHIEKAPDSPAPQSAAPSAANDGLFAYKPPPRPINRTIKDISKSNITRTIMEHYADGKRFTMFEAMGWLNESPFGLSPASASSAMTVLTREGYVERLGKGKFRFIKPLAKRG